MACSKKANATNELNNAYVRDTVSVRMRHMPDGYYLSSFPRRKPLL